MLRCFTNNRLFSFAIGGLANPVSTYRAAAFICPVSNASRYCTQVKQDEYAPNWTHLDKQRARRDGSGESIETLKARLLYQSRKRGNLENGILLSTFADRYLDQLTPKQLATYDTLINLPDNDWDIYYWATGNKIAPKEFHSDVLEMLCKHTQNSEMELRNQQPDLKHKVPGKD